MKVVNFQETQIEGRGAVSSINKVQKKEDVNFNFSLWSALPKLIGCTQQENISKSIERPILTLLGKSSSTHIIEASTLDFHHVSPPGLVSNISPSLVVFDFNKSILCCNFLCYTRLRQSILVWLIL